MQTKQNERYTFWSEHTKKWVIFGSYKEIQEKLRIKNYEEYLKILKRLSNII